MGHTIEWDNPEQTVVLQAYDDQSGKDDLYHLAQKSEAMLNSVTHTVHIIVDERLIDLKLTSADMLYLQKHAPANQGAVIVVVGEYSIKYKELIQRVGKAIAPAAFDKPYFATTTDQARAFLHQNFGVAYPPYVMARINQQSLAVDKDQ